MPSTLSVTCIYVVKLIFHISVFQCSHLLRIINLYQIRTGYVQENRTYQDSFVAALSGNKRNTYIVVILCNTVVIVQVIAIYYKSLGYISLGKSKIGFYIQKWILHLFNKQTNPKPLRLYVCTNFNAP